MTQDKRSNARGHLWLWVLVGLAILATVIMLLTNSNAGLKIALIAALWAAALGAFMVGRYRDDKIAAERELELANQAHQAELRATAAELQSSKDSLELARAQGGYTGADSVLLQELKEEIAALRSQLEDLAGREWGYEPAALHAEARRVRELQAQTDVMGTSSLIDDTPVASELIPEEETPKKEPASRQSTVDTTEMGVVEDSDLPSSPRAPSAEAVAGRVGGYEQPTNRESNPLSQLISERGEESQQPVPEPQPAQRFEPWGEPIVDLPPTPEPEPEPAPEPSTDRPRRRRSDENAGGISVAELMERVRKAEQE